MDKIEMTVQEWQIVTQYIDSLQLVNNVKPMVDQIRSRIQVQVGSKKTIASDTDKKA